MGLVSTGDEYRRRGDLALADTVFSKISAARKYAPNGNKRRMFCATTALQVFKICVLACTVHVCSVA